jgi:oxygen-independent coproporphyrinogen-3 oxidase
MKKEPISIYIHWPFCKSKCPYCDFNSHVRESVSHKEWLNAYIQEIKYFSDQIQGKSIASIFFGGGTPSLANPFIMEGLIDCLAVIGDIDNHIEITLEANPTSIEAEKFQDFRKAGINRVSVGVQSLRDDNLKFLGREHSSYEALKALEIAQNTFDRHTFDLIYSLPNQTLKDWQYELEKALAYSGKHISLYQLTIEKGTRFFKDHKDGKFEMPDENLSADMYEFTTEFMESKGMPYYEISNYAAMGEESRHNLCYWRYGDYIGIGPGAHGRYTKNGEKYSTQMISSPEQWLKNVGDNGIGLQVLQKLSEDQVAQERLLMGLRLREGVKESLITNRRNLENFIRIGLVERNRNNISATRRGMLVLNAVIEGLL